jgi:hypothetical protein
MKEKSEKLTKFDFVYEYAPTTSEIPPPCTFAPLEVEGKEREGLDVEDDAVQKVNMLLDKVKLLLLTVVPPTTEPEDVMYEYAPTTREIPPPYTFAPLEVEEKELDVDDDAEQDVSVLLDKVKLLLLTVVPQETEPADVMYEYAPKTRETPPPYTFAPLDSTNDREEDGFDVDDDAEQAVNVLLEMENLLLLTAVPPKTGLLDGTYEYAPKKSEIPPPYTFAPLERDDNELDVVDDAVQEVNVLLEIVQMLLLTPVPALTENWSFDFSINRFKYAPIKSEIPPPYTFAPLEEMVDKGLSAKPVVDDEAVQNCNTLLKIVKLLLLIAVALRMSERENAGLMNECAPKTSAIPPPYVFTPETENEAVNNPISVEEDAMHEVIVFFEMI